MRRLKKSCIVSYKGLDNDIIIGSTFTTLFSDNQWWWKCKVIVFFVNKIPIHACIFMHDVGKQKLNLWFFFLQSIVYSLLKCNHTLLFFFFCVLGFHTCLRQEDNGYVYFLLHSLSLLMRVHFYRHLQHCLLCLFYMIIVIIIVSRR